MAEDAFGMAGTAADLEREGEMGTMVPGTVHRGWGEEGGDNAGKRMRVDEWRLKQEPSSIARGESGWWDELREQALERGRSRTLEGRRLA